MLAVYWQDTGTVYMLSTIWDTGTVKVQVKTKTGERTVIRPNVREKYNSFMGGVDHFDHFCSTYPFNRKNKKWYQTIWHFIIEIALVNGHIAYNMQNNTKMNQDNFRKAVIDGLVQNYTRREPLKMPGRKRQAPLRNRLRERHFISKYEDNKHRPNCYVCSIERHQCKKKGKGNCKRKQTRYFCAKCKKALCIVPCFEEYHTKVNFRKVCNCSS